MSTFVLAALLTAGLSPQQAASQPPGPAVVPGVRPPSGPEAMVQGQWTVVYAERNAQRVETGNSVVIKGDTLTFTLDGKEHTMHVTFGPRHMLHAFPAATGAGGQAGAPAAPGSAAGRPASAGANAAKASQAGAGQAQPEPGTQNQQQAGQQRPQEPVTPAPGRPGQAQTAAPQPGAAPGAPGQIPFNPQQYMQTMMHQRMYGAYGSAPGVYIASHEYLCIALEARNAPWGTGHPGQGAVPGAPTPRRSTGAGVVPGGAPTERNPSGAPQGQAEAAGGTPAAGGQAQATPGPGTQTGAAGGTGAAPVAGQTSPIVPPGAGRAHRFAGPQGFPGGPSESLVLILRKQTGAGSEAIPNR